MEPPRDKHEALGLLARSFVASEQLKLREHVEKDAGYYREIVRTYLKNPFLRLTDDELAAASRVRPAGLAQLIAARDAATRSAAPKYVVFCMPKSGSSFVQSALQHALELPFVSLTSFGAPAISSHFGMNGREQELDEMAVARAVLTCPNGFVAQHHTRYTAYLKLQMALFGVTPIVTVRNIFDCIVSFDEMMLRWRGGNANASWVFDAQFALPAGYPDLEAEARYGILAHSYGVWLINFYLSWKRGRAMGLRPLMIRYEDHVLEPDRLVETLAGQLRLSSEQTARLRAYAHRPDREAARLNVGRRGRGAELISERIRGFLTDYAGAFRGELSAEDLDYLVA